MKRHSLNCVAFAVALAWGGLLAHGLVLAAEPDAGPAAKVKVLAFDVLGTVADWRSSLVAEGEAFGRAKGLKVDWAAFMEAWQATYGPSMNKVRTGELPWTNLDDLHRMAFEDMLRRFRIEGITEEDKTDLNRVWRRLDPWPDAVPGLTRLRKRFVIASLSNANLSLLTHMAKHAGFRGTVSCRRNWFGATSRTLRSI